MRIGCSGWDYAHWKARFHAAEVPRRLWLEAYTRAFDTVELNNSFWTWVPRAYLPDGSSVALAGP